MRKWIKPVFSIYCITLVFIATLLWILKLRFDNIFSILGFKGIFFIGAFISVFIGLLIYKIIINSEDNGGKDND